MHERGGPTAAPLAFLPVPAAQKQLQYLYPLESTSQVPAK